MQVDGGSGIPPYAAPPGYYTPEMAPPPRVRIDAIGDALRLLQQELGVWAGSMAVIVALYAVAYVAMFVVMVPAMRTVAAGGRGGHTPPIPPTAVLGLFGRMALIYPVILLAVVFLMCGYHRMAIKQVRGEPISIADVFRGGPYFWRALGATLLVGLASAVGMLFCIVPGYLVAGMLMLTLPLIVDRGLGVLDAMRASWRALSRDMWMAALLYFVANLVAGIGIYACGVGVLFTYPLLFLTTAVLYRDFFLSGVAQGNQPPHAAPLSDYPEPSPPAAQPSMGSWPPFSEP